MMILSIVILSYNTKRLTIRCIESISGQYKKQLENGEFEILVVDNASSDGSIESIKSSESIKGIKRFQLIENRENYGFSKGNNIGAKHAKGRYIFFLNSDTTIENGGLAGMVGFLDTHKNVGVLGGRLVNVDGTNQVSAGSFYTIPKVIAMLLGGKRLGFLRFNPKQLQMVDWVVGASMMVRKDLFEKFGGFDEQFFMYVEDMELCFRAKKMGFLTYFYPEILICHRELGSSNRAFAIIHIYKGLLHFYKKHTDYIQYTLVKLLLAAKALIAIAVGILTRNAYLRSTYRKALSLTLGGELRTYSSR